MSTAKQKFEELFNKVDTIEEYADPVNKRFALKTQKDADQLFGKIRRLSGRDEIRQKAISIIVKQKLFIPEDLLTPWPDKVEEDSNMNSPVVFKYLSKSDREKLPKSDFGLPDRLLFPITDANSVAAAAKLLGRAKISEEERRLAKKRIIAIAKRKNFPIPQTWQEEMKASNDNELSVNDIIYFIAEDKNSEDLVRWTSSGLRLVGKVKSKKDDMAKVEIYTFSEVNSAWEASGLIESVSINALNGFYAEFEAADVNEYFNKAFNNNEFEIPTLVKEEVKPLISENKMAAFLANNSTVNSSWIEKNAVKATQEVKTVLFQKWITFLIENIKLKQVTT